jgi:hypothetical protein
MLFPAIFSPCRKFSLKNKKPLGQTSLFLLSVDFPNYCSVHMWSFLLHRQQIDIYWPFSVSVFSQRNQQRTNLATLVAIS